MSCARALVATAAAVAAAVLLSSCGLLLPGGPWQTADQSPWPDPSPVPVGMCPWMSPESSPTPQPAATDPVEATEAIALGEDRFWALVDSIPSAPGSGDFATASSALAGCSFSDVIGFEARLTLLLYALDGQRNWAWYEDNDPLHLGFVSEDVFLYARCATVLAGREAWQRAVMDGTVEWGDDEPDLDGVSEYLLYIAADAAAAQGMGLEEFYDIAYERIPLSYETGSNAELWEGL